MLNKSLNILVAEDNEINQVVFTKMLEILGHNVDVVENGLEVLKKVKSNTYDAIFMDLQMPIMNGIDATKVIKRELEKPPVVIAVTADYFSVDKDNCLDIGMDDCIWKPVRKQDLYEILCKHFVNVM